MELFVVATNQSKPTYLLHKCSFNARFETNQRHNELHDLFANDFSATELFLRALNNS